MRQVVGMRMLAVLVLAVMAIGSGAVCWGQQAVKVHKDLVSVGAPDGAGMVVVRGEPGAVSSNSAVTGEVENRTTRQKVGFELTEDGGFAVTMAAQAGEKLRVQARNREGSSYCTLTVPGGAAEAATEAESSKGPEAGAQQGEKTREMRESRYRQFAERLGGAREDRQGGEEGKLAVIVLVIDTKAGVILASEQISGSCQSATGERADCEELAELIAKGCRALVRTMLGQMEEKPAITVQPKLEEGGSEGETESKP